MATGMGAYEAAIAQRKAALFATALSGAADVAEVGLGAGPNLRYYGAAGVRGVVGVEPNEFMAPYATAAATSAGVPLRLLRGVAEALPLPDASCDAVVTTLVMCTVAEPASALAEIARVLRPGGAFVFIEHVAADATAAPVLAAAQRALDPLQQLLAGGCHLTRATGDLIAARCADTSGALRTAAATKQPPKKAPPLLFASLRMERFDAADAWPITPHVAGVARKAA